MINSMPLFMPANAYLKPGILNFDLIFFKMKLMGHCT